MEVGKENQTTDEFLSMLSCDGLIGHERPFRSLWRRVVMEASAISQQNKHSLPHTGKHLVLPNLAICGWNKWVETNLNK